MNFMTFNIENHLDDYVNTSLVTDLSIEEQETLNNAFKIVVKESCL